MSLTPSSVSPGPMVDAKTLVGFALLLAGGFLILQNPQIQRAARDALKNPQVRAFCHRSLTQVIDAAFSPRHGDGLPPVAR